MSTQRMGGSIPQFQVTNEALAHLTLLIRVLGNSIYGNANGDEHGSASLSAADSPITDVGL